MKAVHAMNVKSGELVLLTALGVPAPLPKRTRQDVESALANTLLQSARRQAPVRDVLGSSEGRFQIIKDECGKPSMVFDAGTVLSVSYSRGSGRLWAALACGEFSVGIDVSDFSDFEAVYELERAFCDREWSWAVSRTGGDKGAAAALLWAAKEATAKALGCDLQNVDPLSLEVAPLDEPSTGPWTRYRVAIQMPGVQSSLELAARPLEGAWCCVATNGRVH